MLRKLKWIMIIITFLITVGFGLGLLFLKTFDPNQYKPMIEKQVSAAIGRNITIAGQLHWKLFPSFSLQVGGLQLTNARGFAFKQYFAAKSININLELMPLMKRDIVLKNIRILNPQLTLHTTKHGKHNWQMLNDNAARPKAPATNVHATKNQSKLAPGINIADIIIEDAKVVYQNDQSGVIYKLSGLSYRGQFKQKIPTTERGKPYASLRHLTLKGELAIKRADLNKVNLRDIHADLGARGGVFTVQAVVKDMYRGQSTDKLRVDVTAKTPRLTLTRDIKNVQINGLFDDLGYSNRINGVLRGHIHIETNDINNMPKTLNGKGSINIDNGSIQGVSLSHAILTASAFFNRKSLPSLAGTPETPFESMTGDIVMRRGNVSTDNLMIRSKMLEVSGKGNVDLNAKKLDYRLRAKTLGMPENDKLSKAQQFLGGGFPLRAKGSLSKYKVIPDYEDLAKSAAKYFIKKELGDKLDGLGKKLLKDGNNSLHNLLKKNKDKTKGKNEKMQRLLEDIFN